MKIGMLLRQLHEAESDLAQHLLRVSDRHQTDHEVHHLARDLARWSQEHLRSIAEAAPRYEEKLDAEPPGDSSIPKRIRETSGRILGHRSEPSLLLLEDLRKVYIDASGVSVDWVMLAQVAQARKDVRLLELVQRCHPDTLRQLRWANALIKELSAQALLT